MSPHFVTEHLIAQADEAYFGPAWHGPSLQPTLKKLSAAEARKVSPFEGFTAWGVALHTGYWKYRGGALLAKATRPAFDWPSRFFRGPANWPTFSDDDAQWPADRERLDELHTQWTKLLAAFPENAWDRVVRSDGLKASILAFGVASHDLYHTAQIRNMGVKEF